RAGCAVARGAVGQEQGGTLAEVAVLGMHVGDRWAVAERSHIGRERVDVALGECGWLADRLRGRVREGHAAGAELEVGGGRAHADQGRPDVRSSTVDAVATRARWEEEVASPLQLTATDARASGAL